MAEKIKKGFALLDEDNNEIAKFTSYVPRPSAMKAARKGHTNIRLKAPGLVPKKGRPKKGEELGYKVHVFAGERHQRPRKASDPDWIPEMTWEATVRKVCIEWLPKSAFPKPTKKVLEIREDD